MGVPAVSFARKITIAAVVGLLACSLVPFGSAFAEGEGAAADASTEEPQEASASQSDASSGVAPTLASGLVGSPSSFVSADVALDGEPVIGSFTVDGMTFAVTGGTDVELVGVSSDWQQVMSSQEGEGSPVAPMLASGPDGSDADSSVLALPGTITYEGVDYAVTSIGAYAFYLSGVAPVELPATVTDVDDRAFRSSDVSSVAVAEGNATYSSFDGALYDAAQLSLLLIPEGKQGTVLLPMTAESAAPSVFSHCPLVTQVSVEEGSAAFASENGLLYDASLTTLLRVPAGATDITIRDGCTTIAAGALEACASLATITAPESVTSISPDVFTQPVETLVIPATALVQSESAEEGETAPIEPYSSIVALTAFDADMPAVSFDAIEVFLPESASRMIWRRVGLERISGGSTQEKNRSFAEGVAGSMLPVSSMSDTEDEGAAPVASAQSASTYAAYTAMTYGLAVNDAGMGSLVTTAEKVLSGSVLGPNSSISAGSSPMKYTMTLSGTSYRIERTDGCYIAGYVSPSAGYEFKGWADTPTGTPQSSMSISHEASAGSGVLTVTRYAIFAKKASLTVTLDKNATDATAGTSAVYCWPDKGYTTSSTSTTVVAAGSKLVSSLPTRSGYTFAGFYSTSASSGGTQYVNASGNLTSSAPALTSGTTWYARWTKNAISTVNLYQNAGDTTTKYKTVYLWYGKGWYSTASPTDSSTALSTIGTPARAGYAYKGFSTSSTSTTGSYWTTVTTFPSNTSSTFGSATTAKTTNLYAVWSKNAISTVNLYQNAGDTTTKYKTVYLWYGKGWYSTASPTDSSTALSTIGTPTRAGYTYKGFATSSTATTGTYWTAVTSFPGNTNTTFGSATTAKTVNLYAVWAANSYNMLFDPHGGTGGQSGRVLMTYLEELPAISKAKPSRAGYAFEGWYLCNPDTEEYVNVVYDSACEPVLQVWPWGALALNSDGTPKLEIHAKWAANSYNMLFDPHGGTGGQSGRVLMTYLEELPAISKAKPSRAGYAFEGWYLYNPDTEEYLSMVYDSACEVAQEFWPWGALALNSDGTPKPEIHAKWTLESYSISYGLDGGTVLGSSNPTRYDVETATFALENPQRQGYVFTGWSGTGLEGSSNIVVQVTIGSSGDRFYEAHWVPAISADAPIDVTVSVDLLGIEDQVPASGYIESRSGGALEVAAVDFAPLDGAAALFGSRTADVALEALAGEGATSAAVSFSLDAEATEADAAKLAAFALPDGFGTRIPIGYRFAIPDDVLSSIDPARFEQVTTPVCSVYYTVALAS